MSHCMSMVPLASMAWANSSQLPFMCKGTKGENNICIFHHNPYNIWVDSCGWTGIWGIVLLLGTE